MASSTSGKYNSPSCTLKIRKKTAPLLGWLRANKSEKIYFELHFNDVTKASQTEKIIISGDREKLQQLCLVVNNYVQQFLALNPARLSLKLAKATASGNSYAPSLQPKSLLAHQLFLGSLATKKSGKQIELSPLQLFDLATALEKYSADLATIEQNMRQKARLNLPLKTSLAAVGIALLGLGAISLRLLNPPIPATQTISLSNRDETESVDRSFEVLAPPPLQNPPQPKPSLPTTSPELESPQPPPKEARSPTITAEKNVTKSPQISRKLNPELPPLPFLEEPFVTKRNLRYSVSKDSIAATQSPRGNNATAILAEVNNYLQQRWQPPKDFNRSLEYRLIIDRSGSLDRVIPLGYSSQVYRDRTGIPLEGETFVSQLSTQDKLRIRVFLIQDGSVKTFLE